MNMNINMNEDGLDIHSNQNIVPPFIKQSNWVVIDRDWDCRKATTHNIHIKLQQAWDKQNTGSVQRTDTIFGYKDSNY